MFDWLPEQLGVTKALRDQYYETQPDSLNDFDSKFLLVDIGNSVQANNLTVMKVTQKSSMATTLKTFLTHFFSTQSVLNWEVSPTFLITTETRVLKSLNAAS